MFEFIYNNAKNRIKYYIYFKLNSRYNEHIWFNNKTKTYQKIYFNNEQIKQKVERTNKDFFIKPGSWLKILKKNIE